MSQCWLLTFWEINEMDQRSRSLIIININIISANTQVMIIICV